MNLHKSIRKIVPIIGALIILGFVVLLVYVKSGPDNLNTDDQSILESNAQISIDPIENRLKNKYDTPDKVLETENITIETSVPYSHSFDSYIEQNEDFMGWITIDGTSINEPFVQGNNNEHYLTYDYLNKKNPSGAVYLDYRNLGDFTDDHMVLYGHYMKDGTIFKDLHLYKDEAFFSEHSKILIQGLNAEMEYEIFSVNIVSADTFYLRLNLKDESLFEYANYLLELSIHKKKIEFPTDLKLLTVVTCTYEFGNARILIHAFQK